MGPRQWLCITKEFAGDNKATRHEHKSQVSISGLRQHAEGPVKSE